MFPAIRQAIKEIREGFGSEPISLDLKSDVSFTPENVGWYARNGFPKLYDLLGGGGPSWSGESVNVATASNLSVVWACRRLISGTGSMIPLDMMQSTSAGKFPADGDKVPAHPLFQALKYAPNEEMSSMSMREALIGNLLFSGNGFARIFRRSGTQVAYELDPLEPGQVQMDRDKQRRRVYVVDPDTPGAKTYTVEPGKPHDILHIIGPSLTGREGQGVIAQARQSMGAALSADRYASHYYARGGRQPGYLKVETRFKTDQDEKKFVEDLNAAMDGPGNYHKWPVFPPSVDFKPWGWSPEDSQFLQTREFNVPEICRWFLISPDLVGDMSKATLNNIEQLAIRFVKMTMTEWLIRIEQDARRCLLTPKEKSERYYFRHNVDGLLRGDFLARMQGYATALQNGYLSINEVRDLEDRNPVEGGDEHHIQLNLQPIDGVQSPALVKVGKRA